MIDELLANNGTYAAGFDQGHLAAPPARRLAVLTCMDARILPLEMLGLALGDAHVIRNAGGRASPDALRSLAVSSHVLGVRHVLVVHHTECGMATTNEALRERTGLDLDDFLVIGDPEQAVRDDVAAIAGSGVLAEGTEVRGMLYDVRSGKLRVVD